MIYHNIQPPFTLEFFEMSKKELGEYAAWLHGITDERMSELEGAVRSSPGYEAWRRTFEPESLRQLGEWFASAITTRPRTSDEIGQLRSLRDVSLSVRDVELTKESFSLAFDVGLYLARTLERAHPRLAWKQFLNDKRFADYGQPVLTGFGRVPFNPVGVAVTMAYGLASGKQTGKRLSAVFDYWSNHVSV